HERRFWHADRFIPDVGAACLMNNKVIGAGESQFVQDGQGVLIYVAKAIVKGNAENLSLLLSSQVRNQLAHTQTPVAQTVHPDHLSPKAVRMHRQASKR